MSLHELGVTTRQLMSLHELAETALQSTEYRLHLLQSKGLNLNKFQSVNYLPRTYIYLNF